MPKTVQLEAVVRRTERRALYYVIVPNSTVRSWGLGNSAVVDGDLNGVELGRHFLNRVDEQYWYIGLSHAWCVRADVAPGDRVRLSLRIATTDLPHALARRISLFPSARQSWEAMTRSQQTDLRRLVVSARTSKQQPQPEPGPEDVVDVELFDDDHNSWAELAQLDDSE